MEKATSYMHQFASLADAKAKIEAWWLDYNHRRPHSSLGDLTQAATNESSRVAAFPYAAVATYTSGQSFFSRSWLKDAARSNPV